VTGLLLVGGGGHCRSSIDVIETVDAYRIRGVVEAFGSPLTDVLGYPVLGFDTDLEELLGQEKFALITVGQIKTPKNRIRLFTLLKNLNALLPTITSPFARCSPHSEIGEGTIVMHGALVNAGSRVGVNCIINSQALIEHDSVISDHCHISTGARVNGGVSVGEGSFIGSGAIIREGISIGNGAVIGAGQVVIKDVPGGAVVSGKHA
jgi:sugar O-acyltransferase (sialic acid O-acetyltransferase NeuD family)